MRVIVTRPLHEATAWVEGLRHANVDAQALPLMEIAPPTHPQPLLQAWQQWTTWDAVMFVSAQAVRMFFAQRPHDIAVQPGPRCWATGPGTQRALVQAGVSAAQIDAPLASAAQFDSEALWHGVHERVRPGQTVLIVRGSDADTAVQADSFGSGREWLAEQLQARGVQVQRLAAYTRVLPRWSEAQLALAQAAANDGSVWLFSSSQAVAHLAQLMPQTNWAQTPQARAMATHPRIAQAVKALGFAQVIEVRPVVADVVASLECLA